MNKCEYFLDFLIGKLVWKGERYPEKLWRISSQKWFFVKCCVLLTFFYNFDNLGNYIPFILYFN